MALRIQQREKTQYKRPRFLNAVSVVLLLIAGTIAYVGITLWPVYNVRSEVENEMSDALPQLWRYNLRPEEVAVPEMAKIKQRLVERIQEVGVKDKRLIVTLIRGKEKVAIEARYTDTAVFAGWGKKVDFALAPRVETSAARVEW